MATRGVGREHYAWRAVVMTGILITAGCEGAPHVEKEPVEIGVLTSLTGDLASLSVEFNNAFDLALEEINDGGGVLEGRPVKIFIVDDGTTPDGARQGYQKLIDRRSPVIIGPMFSGGVVAIVDQIRTGRTLTISPSATSPALTSLSDGGFFYRLVASDAVQGIVLAQAIIDSGRDKACLVFRNDSWGSGLAQSTKENLKLPEGNVVMAPYDPEAQDFGHVLDPCDKLLGQEGVGIVFITFIADGVPLIDDAERRGLASALHKVFLCDGNKDPTLIQKLKNPKVLNGAIGTTQCGPDPSTTAGEELKNFSVRFQKKYGKPPFTYSENVYDAAYLAAMAIEVARSATDTEAITNAIGKLISGSPAPPGEWAATRVSLNSGAVHFHGASGTVNLDVATGDRLAPYFVCVWTVESGEIKVTRTVTVE
ncbi:MAG: ABC transporter substrate-binding protein [Deltaproteobacteria bacterium]|nr:ABC transporter substrate-binding protein [Deltaproteobacteria bacterium]